ncbi:hypothetical protein HJC23_005035 [Cyclotella cryptica]|uniref:RNA polymerase II-associated protein 1 C-terminal domain-containing protein n=1 Tax=Cyclotella cryptica TaxID=29204 RepID=A0ABD3QE53_9STRA|eukprot:CCRYP_006248-RA/>CCRYP_006248-RA protein AED:0.00 eAED:0.00 QI:70/-1/1/1/-1/1/1/208/1458
MANTEGISDEALCSLLTISAEDAQTQRGTGDTTSFDRRVASSKPGAPRFPRRHLARREQMMELGEGERPAAMVIRSSKPPVIHSSSSLNKKAGAETVDNQSSSVGNVTQPVENHNIPEDDDAEDEQGENKQVGMDRRPVILSESIRERPVSSNSNPTSHLAPGRAKESRFKQRNRNKITPTAGGFPSLDFASVGTLTRKGKPTLTRDCCPLQNASRSDQTSHKDDSKRSQTNDAEKNGVGLTSDSMLANMSLDDIRDGIDEITSILSPASIDFLRKRGQKKKTLLESPNANQSGTRSVTFSTETSFRTERLSKEAELELEEQRVRAEKEQTAQILSSVRTPEDMDRAYNEALMLGLATELPSSTLETGYTPEGFDGQASANLNDIEMLTSLLRSTALRQRLLAAKTLCSVLESDFNKIIETRRMKSFSCDDDKRTLSKTGYPPLLPVALRCLLDDAIAISHTPVGCNLLSLALPCVHYLLMLFVHPYHLVCVTQTTNIDDDPNILSQTCFMSEISHIPAGSELYPPTTIEPICNDGDAKGCYRADSSSASAESDSKSFYDDPAWTLLSRMRIIPCLSNALVCISKYTSAETAIFMEKSISSICGILALLSVRSPGASAAISGHDVILPFIAQRCMSPSMDESNNSGERSSLFRASLALPALKLFCLLAQQSKDIAELETPFETVVSDVHAILCLGHPNEEELVLQTWSLILIRILLRYGLATNHIQSLIQLSATQMTLQNRNEICAHYLSVFSRVCDSAMTKSYAEGSTFPEDKDEHGDEDTLTMSGVWLASSAKSSVSSLLTIVKEHHALPKHEQFTKMKLASAEVEFLASYLSATNPSNLEGTNPLWAAMKSSFIPALSLECCTEVNSSIMNSPMLMFALDIALRWVYSADWHEINDDRNISIREEAVACSFIKSYMKFNLGHRGSHRDHLVNKILEVLKEVRIRHQSTMFERGCINPSRRSWFVEAEFSVLKILCNENATMIDNDILISFAFSLLGRMAIGDEALSNFIFQQDNLFQVNETIGVIRPATLSNATFLQNAFLNELSGSEERKAQLNHSSAIHFTKIPHRKQCKLKSLRSRFSFGGKAEVELLLPLGGIWLWNVLSSTMTVPAGSESAVLSEVNECGRIVSHALGLLLRMDLNNRSSVAIGTKLYHTANVCMYPEAILRDDFVQSAATLLYTHFTSLSSNSTLVGDFISACHQHSRVSRGGKGKRVHENPQESIVAKQNNHEMASKEELRALEDFVGDMCDAYIEYGGQYEMFTIFMRFFLRHEFPATITTSLLSKLYPVLNILSLDEDRAVTSCSLFQSVSGGMPSIDGSRRDPGIVLDSFSDALKKKDRELMRRDYAYLLAVAVLSRNLSSSSQRCECGVQAMKHRLSGIQSTAFYDIVRVCERFLHDGKGSKESLVDYVMDICLNDEEGLSGQSEFVRTKWTSDVENWEALWDSAMSYLSHDES